MKKFLSLLLAVMMLLSCMPAMAEDALVWKINESLGTLKLDTSCSAVGHVEIPAEVDGVAVMAHPRFWTSDAGLLADGLARLKDIGLDGVEAVYQANLPLETPLHLRLTRSLGLAVTAGSDFHGANKNAITLGMDVEDERDFIAPLLDALARRGWREHK